MRQLLSIERRFDYLETICLICCVNNFSHFVLVHIYFMYLSMQGKDMLQVVKPIREEKSRNVEAKKAKKNQKLNDRAASYKCKETCMCHKSKCEASGLKECSSCHNVLRSIRGKVGCRKMVNAQ